MKIPDDLLFCLLQKKPVGYSGNQTKYRAVHVIQELACRLASAYNVSRFDKDFCKSLYTR